jgi:hypothetical protein
MNIIVWGLLAVGYLFLVLVIARIAGLNGRFGDE